MDVVQSIHDYVEQMVTSVPGMKVLLLDEHTVPDGLPGRLTNFRPPQTEVLSVVLSQSYLLEHEIFLTDRLDHEGREALKCMTCIVFCRPTAGNVEVLVEELRAPKYAEYRFCTDRPPGWCV